MLGSPGSDPGSDTHGGLWSQLLPVALLTIEYHPQFAYGETEEESAQGPQGNKLESHLYLRCLYCQGPMEEAALGGWQKTPCEHTFHVRIKPNPHPSSLRTYTSIACKPLVMQAVQFQAILSCLPCTPHSSKLED